MKKKEITSSVFLKLLQNHANAEKDSIGILSKTISGYYVKGACSIDNNIVINYKCTIENCEFENELEFNQFEGNFYLGMKGCVFKQDLSIVYSSFKHPVSIGQIFSDWILISEVEFDGGLTIENVKTNLLRFGNNRIKKGVLYFRKEIETKSFELLFGEKSEGSVDISDLKVEKLMVSGTNEKSTVNIINVELDNFVCLDFFTNSHFVLNNIKASTNKSFILLKNTFFNKTQLLNIDFTKFKSVSIIDCSLTELTFNSIQWPSKIYSENKNDYTVLRETYRQLKYLTSKQGDIITSLEFKALEMNAYLSALNQKRGRFWDKFILYTNKLSNNHGLSWSRALFWIISLNAILYNTITNGQYTFSLNKSDIIQTLDEFLQVINPLHSKIYFRSIIRGQFSYLIESISRIINSYLLFQFLRAFRKYA